MFVLASTTEEFFRKTGKETPNQEHKRWEGLNAEHPNSASVEHQFDNGWTVQKLRTRHDVNRTGKFMRNCWQGKCVLYPKKIDEDSGYYTLNDEKGLPRAAFNNNRASHLQNVKWAPPRGVDAEGFQGPGIIIQQPLGMRNSRLTPFHADLFRQWAQARNLPIAVDWGGQPLHFEHPTIQNGLFSGKGHVFDGGNPVQGILNDPNPVGAIADLEDTDMYGNRWEDL